MKKLLVLQMFCWFGILKGLCQPACELKISKDSIVVYTCKSTDSKLKSIKANFTVNAKLSVLAGHLLDVKDYVKWQYNVIHTEVIQKISESEMIYHSEVEAPWPLSNREVVMHLKITQDPMTKVMIFETTSVPGFIPENDDLVRVKRSHVKWVVTPISNNELKVDYSFEADPGGSIPSWIINLSLAEGPYQTFRNIKKRINSGVKISPAGFIVD